MLHAAEVTKRYGSTRALDGFSLDVAAGEVVGLIGHNGAGKTTFAEVLSGVVRPDSGRVLIDGRPPEQARGRVGIAPQALALYPGMTVHEHLRFFAGLKGIRGNRRRLAVDEVVSALELTAVTGRRVGLLSGGQQRRTQAAVALLGRPALLVLDEPTAGADPRTRRSLLRTVRDRAQEGAAVVYTTHYLPELTDLGATVAVARQGRVVARGTAAGLRTMLPEGAELHADAELPADAERPADADA